MQSRCERRPIEVLIGQSLGCWFALRVLESLDEDEEEFGPPVVAVHLLSPVFQDRYAESV